MKVTLLGYGSWGKAVGGLLERNGHRVTFVHHGDQGWPPGAAAADFVLIALPVQHIRETLARFEALGAPVLSLSKGLEIQTGARVSTIVGEVWGEKRVGSLSGPSFAVEVDQGLPAMAVSAAEDDALAERFQILLHQPAFRIYRSTDLTGVEIAGALKNVYAIAGGMCVGLRLGESSFAGLITRCLAEMTRIGVRLGARPETFAGLSGIGDLILTAMSGKSRNHRVGRLLAEGCPLDAALSQLGGVAEGVPTARSLYQNPSVPPEHKPTATQIYEILFESKPIAEAIRCLLEREAKPET